MNWISNFWKTSVGRKQFLALSGLMLVGFLVVHLSGNFLLLVGDDGVLFNNYAAWLHKQPWLLPAEIVLILLFLAHIVTAIKLSAQNRAARGSQGYHYKSSSDASFASRYMILTGLLVLGFLIIHLINFTYADQSGDKGLYGLVLAKFTDPIWGSFYVVCMIILTVHLVHGIQSVFQTFGFRHPKFTTIFRRISILLSIGLGFGFAFIPIWFLIKGGS